MRYILTLVIGLLLPTVLQAQVTEVWSTKGPDDYPFALVLGIQELSPDRIWVFDPQSDPHAFILDGQGRFLGHALRDGEGPGEVTTVHRATMTPEGGLALAVRTEIHFLDAEGSYRSKMTLPYYPGAWSDLLVTDHLVVNAAGVRPGMGATVHRHSVFVHDRETGELLSSFHPSNPTPGMPGVAQTRTRIVPRGENLLVVNAAPLEVVEYEPRSGRRLRTLVPLDSSLVNDPGEGYSFRMESRPTAILSRRHYPRVRYAELRAPDRLLVISVFPREDWIIRPDELALDTPIEEFERSVWDVYDLETGERVSRTETDRAYVVFDRTSDGGYLATYTTRLDEDVVAKVRFEPE